ncbi:MAG: hypothetical protein Q7W13_01675 [Bacteroidia bacterium]|nr:hypothetical protein [Bacteroidia bacterium]
MKKLIKIQLIVAFAFCLLYVFLLLGVLTDVKYIVEASTGVSNRVITTVYDNISTLSLLFFVLSIFVIINAFLLLKKANKDDNIK